MRWQHLALTVLAALLVLSGCTGDSGDSGDSGDPGDPGDTSEGAEPDTTIPPGGAPDGERATELTEPGPAPVPVDGAEVWTADSCFSHLDRPIVADRQEQAETIGDRVRWERIAELDQPTNAAFRCGDDAIYVAEKEGLLLAVRGAADDTRGGTAATEVVLDLRDVVNAEGTEQGLLGIAFAPDGDRLYVNYTGDEDETRVVELAVDGSGRVDAESRRRLLVIPHPDPQPFHQAGHMAFGPDGMLYVAMGDGGPNQREEAQDRSSLYGTIMRLDVDLEDGRPYAVPDDNPYAGAVDPGTADARDDPPTGSARGEIWVWGLRNPWRFSFDRATGDLWVGDVGDLYWEEVSMVPFPEAPGTYFGWPTFEGSHPHLLAPGPPPAEPRQPVLDYPHGGFGCGVIGGHVYRGEAIPELRGVYVLGDLCWRDTRALVLDEQSRAMTLAPLADLEDRAQPVAFAEDPDGELYALSFDPGGLWRLVPAPPSEEAAPRGLESRLGL